VEGEAVNAALREHLLAFSGVAERPSRFGSGSAFFRGAREFAHFHSATQIDLRLTRKVIATFAADSRLVKRRGASDWIAFNVVVPLDVLVARALATLAHDRAGS